MSLDDGAGYTGEKQLEKTRIVQLGSIRWSDHDNPPGSSALFECSSLVWGRITSD